MPIMVWTLGISGSYQVAVSGELVDSEPHSNLFSLPFRYSENIAHVNNFRAVLEVSEPLDLWLSGKHTEALRLALVKAAGQEMHFLNPKPQFFQSAYEMGFCHERTKANALIRACVETLADINLSGTHPLRINPAGSSPPRIRRTDQAMAWRRDIDYEYHLHYWKRGDSVEFASIVKHNDFDIPE